MTKLLISGLLLTLTGMVFVHYNRFEVGILFYILGTFPMFLMGVEYD